MIKRAHFIGIGGIGMSALAQHYLSQGWTLSGYDRVASPITKLLESKGAKISFDESIDAIPNEIKEERESLIVYTPAISKENKQLQWFREEGYRVVKRAEALSEISKERESYAVAGSHGKTSISTLLAHLFTSSGVGATSFLGGVSLNYGSNFLLSDSPLMVVEADEYDRSFHLLWPEVAIITSVDADHLDIYGKKEAIVEAYQQFARQVKEGGKIIVEKRVEPLFSKEVGIVADLLTYSLEGVSDYYASDIEQLEGGNFKFTFNYPEGKELSFILGVGGKVNLENGIAAAAAAHIAGVSLEAIKEGLESYRGVQRRFEKVIESSKVTYIDDYGHHPVELMATLNTVRELYPKREITALFQPHLYSRTAHFYRELAEALARADRVILLPIYPARELPIEGVTSTLIAEHLPKEKVVVVEKERLIELLNKRELELLISFGAGDIANEVTKIERSIREKYSV